jgi:hypothetical protein
MQDNDPKGLCVHCNGREADAPLVTGKGYPPNNASPFWLRRNRVK